VAALRFCGDLLKAANLRAVLKVLPAVQASLDLKQDMGREIGT
jgi:hypothetical protein